jgi:glycosyltransferase involved in cell wall biosynthesis
VRILFVSNGYPPRGQWGTEFYTRELVRGLASRGHELGVLVPDRGGARARYTLECEPRAETRLWSLHNPGDAHKRFEDSYRNERVEQVFGELLAEWKPDLVHFTYLLWGLSVRLPCVARAAGIPSLVTLTDYGLVCHRAQMYDWQLERCFGPHPPALCARCVRTPSAYDHPAFELWLRRTAAESAALFGGLGRVAVARDLEQREQHVRAGLDAASVLIAPTENVAQAFLRFGVAESKIERLVYALDDAPLRAARAVPQGPCVFGYLGQFTPHKGLGTLLAAIERMRHRLPESVEPWSLRLYGAASGGRHRLYARRVLPSGPDLRIEVHPPFSAEQAGGVMAQLSALVLPSEWDENAPLSVLQARAAGVPVIGSAVPGIRAVVEQGVHGLLFLPGDAEALADCMREVVLGRFPRRVTPGLPLAFDAHVDAIERLHQRARLDARHATPHLDPSS